MVQCFIWDILQDDRAEMKIWVFGLVPGSLNLFLGVFDDLKAMVELHLLNLDHQQTLLQLKCGKYFNWIILIEQKR